MSTKKCSKCLKVLPLDRFTKTKNQCKSCRSEYALKLYNKKKADNPDYLKQQADYKMELYWANRDDINDKRYKKRLERDYGITYNNFVRLFESQDGQCKICSREITWRGGRSSAAHVDHCHKNGHVRGLLCFSCNTALGHFQDDPEILRNAIDYLNE